MDITKEDLESSQKDENRKTTIAITQEQGIAIARGLLEDILRVGILNVNIEILEDICYDIETLVDYSVPNIVKDFRLLLFMLYHVKDPKKQPKIIAHINQLLVILDEAKKCLEFRSVGVEPDANSLVEAHLGYLWKNIDLLEYKLYENDAEILQLSFNSMRNREDRIYTDKGYWFNLKTRKIQYSCRLRPADAARYIKDIDTEFDVLQPEILFVYPGMTNCRIRWQEAQRRAVTPKDIAVLHESAEANYVDAGNKIKESFRYPLAEPAPALLIKLHKAFNNGDHLVLEDEQGNLLTVMDLPEDNTPTVRLLRTILPSQPAGCAMLAEVNNNLQSILFSVKALSVITPDKIIRLLY
jgi:hypothetical protein